MIVVLVPGDKRKYWNNGELFSMVVYHNNKMIEYTVTKYTIVDPTTFLHLINIRIMNTNPDDFVHECLRVNDDGTLSWVIAPVPS
jgi:hypothetical protein